MPWSDDSSKEEQLVRRLAYYVHWRSEQIGKAKAAEVMEIDRETLRRYARYNYVEGKRPNHNLLALNRLAVFSGDDLAHLIFATVNSTDFYVFRSLLERTRLAADLAQEDLSQLLDDARIPRRA